MTSNALDRKLAELPARPPITSTFERALAARGRWDNADVWYRSQKQHWLGWLSEYNGPGYYGRKNSHRSAQFIYNHILCPPMVLWLAEATGVSKRTVVDAKEASLSAAPTLAAQSAAIRRVIPWQMIERCLAGTRKRKEMSQFARIGDSEKFDPPGPSVMFKVSIGSAHKHQLLGSTFAVLVAS
jgi:hypothetical protein